MLEAPPYPENLKKLARIFYAEYGAWADREYMVSSDDWSRTIEGSHAPTKVASAPFLATQALDCLAQPS